MERGHTRAIKAQLGDVGLTLLDLEVAWIMPGPPDPWLIELVEIAAELGARNLLCVSSDPDAGATTAKLQAMVDRAAGTGVRVNLEYALFTQVRSIEGAAATVGALEGEAKGVLCDTLHWSRSGGTADAIRALAREWLGYAQLCDGPAAPPDQTDMKAIIDDTLDRRVAMGESGMPVGAMGGARPAVARQHHRRSLQLRPEPARQNSWDNWRRPMDMIFQGCSMISES